MTAQPKTTKSKKSFKRPLGSKQASTSLRDLDLLPKGAKITILCQYFYPENVTAASLPYELACQLVSKGFNVSVVAGVPQEYHKGFVKKREVFNGIKINRIKYVYKDRKSIIGRFVNNLSFFVSVFINRYKFKGSDILITYSSPPINPIVPAFCAKKYKFKLIYVVYDVYPDMAYKFGYLKDGGCIGRLFESANRYVYKRCERIIVLSEEMKKHYIKSIGCKNKVTVIPNWYINKESLDKKTKKDGLSVLYGGNVGVVQDVETLFGGIVSLKDLKGLKFYFAAHGSRLEGFIGELKEQKIKTVVKLDYMLKVKYDDFLDSVDIAIISLDKRMVGLASPSKFYSYIAKGKPVLFIGSKDMDVAKEIINNKIGYVIDNGDYEGFKSIFTKLLKDKSCLAEMSLRARKLFLEKYTLEKCAEQYINVINDLLKKEVK